MELEGPEGDVNAAAELLTDAAGISAALSAGLGAFGVSGVMSSVAGPTPEYYYEPPEFLLATYATVAEAPWSEAEWAVALRFDNPRATVLLRLLG